MATTNGTPNARGSFPPVVLDTTLYDLILSEQTADESIETLCLIKPNSDRSHGNVVPLSDKYIIHTSEIDDSADLAHMQLENCSHLLTFFAGSMKVAFVASEGNTDDATLNQNAVDLNAKRSFGVIQESQRPQIKTYANPDDMIKSHDGSNIRWGFAMDFAERLPYLFHPELIYKLNSKRWLAVSNLRSANDSVLDCVVQCATHQTKDGLWFYGGDSCDNCRECVHTQEQVVKKTLNETPMPYVLKLTQSLSAVGTNIVQNNEDKAALLDRISDYLSTYLPRVTAKNAALYTSSLVLSDFVAGKTMALNFYVRRDGAPVILGACHQLATGTSGRQATAITYADQARLEKKYQSIIKDIAKALHDEGYWGPVGADVMEDPDDERLFAVDLNVRTPLSLLLYLLRTHFHINRGYEMSIVYECIMLKISRDELEERLAKEFDEARIVLLGSTRLGKKEVWTYGVVVAGKNQKEIDEVSNKILDFEIEG